MPGSNYYLMKVRTIKLENARSDQIVKRIDYLRRFWFFSRQHSFPKKAMSMTIL